MATNFFFQNYQNSQEQLLLENLIIESIKIYGQDMFYIPRKLNKYDNVYGADDQSSYEQAYPIEMYIKSIDGFTGDGEFMSKFGIEIRNQVIFSMSQRIFSEEVGEFTTQVRPNEGDLVYFPLNQKCFQIKYVNKFEMFYQLGTLQTWEMTCELFEYSDEVFNTGIPDIDILQQKFSTNELDYTIRTEGYDFITNENGDFIMKPNYDLNVIEGTGTNNVFSNSASSIIDFSQVDPFSEGTF